MKINIIFFLIVLILGFQSCFPYKELYFDKDKTADLSAYKTFAWLPISDSSKLSEEDKILHTIYRNYFTHCFGERNYTINKKEPDLLLELVITTRTVDTVYHEDRSAFNTSYITNPFYSPFQNSYHLYSGSYPKYTDGCKPYKYSEQNFTLNVIDRKLNKLVWTSTARVNVYDTKKMNVHPAAHKMIKKFPVKKLESDKNNHTKQCCTSGNI